MKSASIKQLENHNSFSSSHLEVLRGGSTPTRQVKPCIKSTFSFLSKGSFHDMNHYRTLGGLNFSKRLWGWGMKVEQATPLFHLSEKD